VKDRQTGQNVVLSEKDAELIARLQSGKVPDGEYNDFAVSLETGVETLMCRHSAKTFPYNCSHGLNGFRHKLWTHRFVLFHLQKLHSFRQKLIR
jgi:hypothetical protein